MNPSSSFIEREHTATEHSGISVPLAVHKCGAFLLPSVSKTISVSHTFWIAIRFTRNINNLLFVVGGRHSDATLQCGGNVPKMVFISYIRV